MSKPTLQLLVFVLSLYIPIESFSKNLPDTLMDVPITLLSGDQVTLAEYEDKKPVYLKFWPERTVAQRSCRATVTG